MTTNQPNSQAFATAAAIADAQRAATEAERARCLDVVDKWLDLGERGKISDPWRIIRKIRRGITETT